MQSNFSSNCRRAFKKRKLSFVLAVILGYRLLASNPALASPQGGVVTSGAATISQSGSVTNINQSTNKATLNWQSFSTKPTETVNFNQPSASAITLNRIIGNEKSVLEGALNANGKVFLINSNGILFTKGSTVNTAGLVASTLNLTDEDFNAGNYVFKANGSTGSVINLGTITAKAGGYVALMGNSVSNQGVITATKGTVSLNSGDKITLNFNGDSLVSVTINEGTLNALVENKEAIYADGGSVILTAKAADELLSAQVNNSGLIQARTIDDLKGNINLHAYGGTATISGTLDASAPTSGDGGAIETSGNKVKIADNAVITTKSVNGKNGNWLIDPDGFTIGVNGDITGADLTKALALGNVNIASTSGKGTDGDINVNEAVTWSANTTLTLSATNDININKSITATGTNAGLTLTAGTDININAPVTLSGANAALAMTYGGVYNILTKASYSGAVLDANGNPVAKTDTSGGVYGSITLSGTNASLTMNGNNYTLIHNLDQLAALDDATGTASGYFALAENLDAAGTTYTNSVIAKFSGTLAGLGHNIKNLSLTGSNSVGLIGSTVRGQMATIRDIGLDNANISATGSYVGALVGRAYGGLTIKQAYSTGTVTGGFAVGGLVGSVGATSAISNISNSYSTANVEAIGGGAGGLIGQSLNTSIVNSHATGNATSSGVAAGLVYNATTTSITNSYASGRITGSGKALAVGGLIGIWSTGEGFDNSIINSFTTGNVTGGYTVGGLIGQISGAGASTVNNCYATGTVTSNAATSSSVDGVGGLIGFAEVPTQAVTISNSHASGNVIVNGNKVMNVGGLIGSAGGQSTTAGFYITNSYATGNVTAPGGTYVGGLVGWGSDNTHISGCYATGNVIGATSRTPGGSGNVPGTGGLVGFLSKGSISNSYAAGMVTGYNAGGLVGGIAHSSVTNSYWNAASTSSAFGDNAGTTSTGNKGLNGTQFRDIQHYLDGTIDSLQNYRAAGIEEAGQTSGQAQQKKTARTLLTANDIDQEQSSINDYIVYADSTDYSADIKAINADDMEFEMEEKPSAKKK